MPAATVGWGVAWIARVGEADDESLAVLCEEPLQPANASPSPIVATHVAHVRCRIPSSLPAGKSIFRSGRVGTWEIADNLSAFTYNGTVRATKIVTFGYRLVEFAVCDVCA
jgi:hypothetical protein